MSKIIDNLNAEHYQHPSDISTMQMMKKIPLADRFFRKINELGIDKYYKIQYAGSNILVTHESYPELYKRYVNVCEILNIEKIPKLYVEIGFPNAMAVNVEEPMIIISSDCIEYMTEEEVNFILGHELGHVQCEHVLYSQIALSLPAISSAIQATTLGLGNLITSGVQLGIMKWYRRSEYTCDRAGLLACQNIDHAMGALAKIAGLPIRAYDNFNSDAFLKQAEAFEDITYESSNKFVETLLVMNLSHPWTVMRAKELNKWYQSGRYQALIEGSQIIGHDKKTNTFCHECGEPIKQENAFCTSCGSKFN